MSHYLRFTQVIERLDTRLGKLESALKTLKHDGLISPRTYWPDVNVDDAIHQAKIRWFAFHNQDRQARE